MLTCFHSDKSSQQRRRLLHIGGIYNLCRGVHIFFRDRHQRAAYTVAANANGICIGASAPGHHFRLIGYLIFLSKVQQLLAELPIQNRLNTDHRPLDHHTAVPRLAAGCVGKRHIYANAGIYATVKQRRLGTAGAYFLLGGE